MLSQIMSAYAHSHTSIQPSTAIEAFLNERASIVIADELARNEFFSETRENHEMYETLCQIARDRETPRKIGEFIQILKETYAQDHPLADDPNLEAIAILAYIGKFITEDDLATFFILKALAPTYRLISLFNERFDPTEEASQICEEMHANSDAYGIWMSEMENRSSIQRQFLLNDDGGFKHVIPSIGMLRQFAALKGNNLVMLFKLASRDSEPRGCITLPSVIANSNIPTVTSTMAINVMRVLSQIIC